MYWVTTENPARSPSGVHTQQFVQRKKGPAEKTKTMQPINVFFFLKNIVHFTFYFEIEMTMSTPGVPFNGKDPGVAR